MKSRLKMSVRKLLLTSLILFAAVPNILAESQKAPRRVPELDDMEFKEMVMSVDLGKYADVIKKKQLEEGTNLLKFFEKKEGCNVETFRNKEIILVTIPAKLLFAPNETVLDHKAGEYLEHFKKYLKEPDKYRVLLTMHTDNTGSEEYREILTEERVEAVFDWFDEANGVDTSYLFTYFFGDDQPLYPNDSRENREKNRRLEIYIMPGLKMIEQAKKFK